MAVGDRLRDRIVLWGAPSCVNTAKCLFTGGEKGMDVTCILFDPSSQDVQVRSPLGVGPILCHKDFIVTGQSAILSYIDDKGFGPSLVIRNGVVRAQMYQWTQYATEVVQPAMENDDDAKLGAAFDVLAKRLQERGGGIRGDFICGDFSLADIHWGACANMLFIKGKGSVVESRSDVARWWGCIKEHPSTSKEKLKPFECMPTQADVQGNALRNIDIHN